jgi:hypothetical protein
LDDFHEGTYLGSDTSAVAHFIHRNEALGPTVEHPISKHKEERIRQREAEERVSSCVNCWYIGAPESQTMWESYGGGEGVAIRSSFGRLKGSFNVTPLAVYIGRITYEATSSGVWVLSKGTTFEHERELRAVTKDWDSSTRGVYVDVDLSV